MRKKKNVDRTKYGDYSSKVLDYDGVKVHVAIYGLVSILIMTYLVYSLINGRIALPRRFGDTLYLNGFAMYILFLSLLLLIYRFWLPVIEFYKRKNDFYKRNMISKRFLKYKKWTKISAWTFFILSLIIGIINHNMTK